MAFLFVLVALVVVLGIVSVVLYNSLVTVRNKVDEAWAQLTSSPRMNSGESNACG